MGIKAVAIILLCVILATSGSAMRIRTYAGASTPIFTKRSYSKLMTLIKSMSHGQAEIVSKLDYEQLKTVSAVIRELGDLPKEETFFEHFSDKEGLTEQVNFFMRHDASLTGGMNELDYEQLQLVTLLDYEQLNLLSAA